MKILSLPMGADTGGVTAAIGRAFANQPDWQFRAIISTLNYIGYPADTMWTREVVSEYWRWADVVHLHNSMIAAVRLTKGWKGFYLPKRPYVVEFHGTGFREDPRGHLHEMRRYPVIGVVATLDLWLLAPQLEWLPCPINVEVMMAQRQEQRAASPDATGAELAGAREPDAIRIAHAPTNREVKGTQAFLEAIERLQAEGLPVEMDLIEGVPWSECLRRKSFADIYYDQVQLGYGNNAIEAWGMGIPVVAGAQPATLAEMERRYGSLPFYNADPNTIYDALKALVLSKDLRAEYSAKGLAHVRRFHDERVVVEQLKALYRRAAGIEEAAA